MAAIHTSSNDTNSLNAVKLVAGICGNAPLSVVNEDASKAAELKLPFLVVDGKHIHGFPNILSHISHGNPLLANDSEKKQIESWLHNYFNDVLPLFLSNDKKLQAHLYKQNRALLSSVFFVSNHLTLADLVFYTAVHPLVAQWNDKERVGFLNITRWLDHIQHLPEVTKSGAALPLIPINTDPPASVEQPKEKSKGESSQAGQPSTDTKGKSASTPAKENAHTEVLEQAPAETEQPNKNQKEKPPQQKKEQQPKKEQPAGKGKGGAPKEAAPALSETEDVSRFDIRVGRIVSCKKHEAADSLYVEQIEVGEPEPRQVVSGLVKFIPLEEMQQRRVVILCNLKASNLKGVRSQAMVLCASNEDHTKVELVEPPEGAAPGERVTFVEFPGDPEKVLKKETLDIVLAELKSNSECIATYKSARFMTSAGPCVVKSIANGIIK